MPTDYSKASIYKIVCDDGKFYVGSTVLPLSTRFSQHRRAVESGTNKVYRHIRAIGGADKAHIELINGSLGIKTRDELLKIEDAYIREAMKTTATRHLCLNRNRPRATSVERLAREKMQKTMWKSIHRQGAEEIPIGERVRQYYREHKRLPRVRRKRADPEELTGCECGWDIMRGRLSGHRRTKEHSILLMRHHILQSAGCIPAEKPWIGYFK